MEINVIRTTGDRVTDAPLSQIGDRGVFTKEIDSAVLENTADIAVHSLKDLPTRITEGLALVAITQREDPRDVLIGPQGSSITLQSLPAGARVGSGCGARVRRLPLLGNYTMSAGDGRAAAAPRRRACVS